MKATDLTMPVLGGSRVLVVDGDNDSAATLTAVLRLNGFDARAALSVAETLEAVLVHCPQVVILDPAQITPDWRKLARRLKSFSASPALILLTGDTDPRIRRSALESGVAGFFLKPAEPIVLVKLLTQICHDVTP